MKLFRFGENGAEKAGIMAPDGSLRDASAHVADISVAALGALAALDPLSLPLVPEGARLGACLAGAPNFYCIGLNYSKHAAEFDAPAPEAPILFSKATSSFAGPQDDLHLPPEAKKTDWEVELGVVIGREAYRVSEAEALGFVAGYCLVNDISERAFQLEGGGQWIRGKSLPGFGPIGPYFVTADEVPDPQDLDIWLKVNGEIMQQSHTSDMIFSVAEIVADMSKYMRLQVGDIITTGTPGGVGMGQKPQRFLQNGDVMTLGIAGLGEQRTRVMHG